MAIELRESMAPVDGMRERREARIFEALDVAKDRLRQMTQAIDRALAALNEADALLLDPANADILGELADPNVTANSAGVLAYIQELRDARARLTAERLNYTT